MIDQQIVDYIKLQSNSGKSVETITNELVLGGWKIEDIKIVFNSLGKINDSVPVKKTKVFEAWFLLVPILQVALVFFIFVTAWACAGSRVQSDRCTSSVLIPQIILLLSPILVLVISTYIRKKNNYNKTYADINFIISMLVPALILLFILGKS